MIRARKQRQIIDYLELQDSVLKLRNDVPAAIQLIHAAWPQLMPAERKVILYNLSIAMGHWCESASEAGSAYDEYGWEVLWYWMQQNPPTVRPRKS